MQAKFVGALAVALLAAVGNGLFAFGQRKAAVAANPFIFIGSALVVCLLAIVTTLPLMPRVDGVRYLRANGIWIVISGIGFYLTFLGFFFLYSRFGAVNYALYAVLSILTTSVLVGLVVFREQVNGFHVAAIITALLTVILFSVGQNRLG